MVSQILLVHPGGHPGRGDSPGQGEAAALNDRLARHLTRGPLPLDVVEKVEGGRLRVRTRRVQEHKRAQVAYERGDLGFRDPGEASGRRPALPLGVQGGQELGVDAAEPPIAQDGNDVLSSRLRHEESDDRVDPR